MSAWPRQPGRRMGPSERRFNEIAQFFRGRFLAFIPLRVSRGGESAMSTLLVLEGPEARPRDGQGFPDPSTLDRPLTLGHSERRAQAIPEEKTDAKRESARARIMVVDDMPDVRGFLSDFLYDEGYAGGAFGNATDALQRLDAFRPGVILLDILLPGLSGL